MRRLCRFYKKYDADMVAQIPVILAEFEGNEEELFSRLCARYGPEPTTESDMQVTTTETLVEQKIDGSIPSFDWRERLIYFFMYHNPERLCCVDNYLIQFSGQETEMMRMFVQLYGPEPDPEEVARKIYEQHCQQSHDSSNETLTFSSSINDFALKYDPDLMMTIEKMFAAFSEKIDNTMQTVSVHKVEETKTTQTTTVVSKTTWEPSVLIERVRKFFLVYAPEKVGTETHIASQFVGKEEELLRTLVLKYGKEPTDEELALLKEKNLQMYRQRATRMYQYYDSCNVSHVDALMKSFEGNELDMLRSLVMKYGPEPTDQDVICNESNRSMNNEYSTRVTLMFQTYDPKRLNEVQDLLVSYEGEEEDLIRVLVGKYGPEPIRVQVHDPVPPIPAEIDIKTRVRHFFLVHDPTLLNSIDIVLQNYAGRENELLTGLIARYGPEPMPDHVRAAQLVAAHTTCLSATQRVQAILLRYDAGRYSSVESLLASYVGKEMNLLTELVRKYGAEPSESEAQQLLVSCRVSGSSNSSHFRERLVNMLTCYDPAQLGSVDSILSLYANREEECMMKLCARYGPEPPHMGPSELTDKYLL